MEAMGSDRAIRTLQPLCQAGQACKSESCDQPSSSAKEMGVKLERLGSERLWAKPEVIPRTKKIEASRARTRTLKYRAANKGNEDIMWLIFLEAGVALAVLIGIVAWTMHKKK